jgi:hypothetical protein
MKYPKANVFFGGILALLSLVQLLPEGNWAFLAMLVFGTAIAAYSLPEANK